MSNISLPKELIKAQNFVDGKWIDGTGELITIDSPYYGRPIGEFKESTKKDVQEVVEASKKAQDLWSKTPLKERTQVMFKFREILLRDIDKISEIVSLENGKIIRESKAGILKGVEVLEYALSLQNNDLGGKMEVSRGVFCEYRRIPVGVVASITPFNFPAMVPMWTIPIALTLGNSYIWKPSEKTPLTATYIANSLKEAGLPDGVFSVANGARITVEAILNNDDIRAISFVGSSKIAKLVYQQGSANGKRVLALGGAKNHIILLPDADVEISGTGISDSFTGCAGQRCMAASVLLAVGDTQKHIDQVVKRASSLELGKDMGAIITKEQVDYLNNAIEKAVEAGANLLLDGRNQKPSGRYDGGYWLGPTILENVDPNSEASKIELFGPIISIIKVKNITEAMKIENANKYGNACSVFTSNGASAEKVVSLASAGMVGVNIGVPVPREPFSFGGINYSKFGYGDITGENSLNFWTDIKKVTTKWQKQEDANWMS